MTVMPLTPPSEPSLELDMKNGSVQDPDYPYPCPWIETPLLESPVLSKLAGCKIFLKMENFQPSGSFKSRGIGNLVRTAVEKAPSDTPLHFYASSGGNAGLACVTASTTLRQKSTVVVPFTTKPAMIKKMIDAGATKVIPHGNTIADADLYLRENLLPKDPFGIYVPPFDHQDIWNGAQTLIEECYKELNNEKPDHIVCSVGGGGLLIGICQGLDNISKKQSKQFSPHSFNLQSQSRKETQVIGVETIGCESFYKAIKAKSLITLPGISSIATSLGCVRIAKKALEYGLRSNVHSTLVSDKEAIEACIEFAEDHKVIVEPACGATLALIYSGRLQQVLKVKQDDKMVLVVCGGSNISVEMMYNWKKEFDL
ncbi:uncharacterized protein L201_006461 [Kwoniella dendrophila CBS 6074]|uniref:L-serine ammonia-lyase n=1 Tax=Kwoniella dendrophila CBS 6074 TaxID=1295534 RepID=A0AAX4K3Y8_9TREE